MSNWKEMTLIELKESSVRDLQKWCKEAGIKAGVAKDDMAQRLFGIEWADTTPVVDHDDGFVEEDVEDAQLKKTGDDPQKLTSPMESESQVGKPCRMPNCTGVMQSRGAGKIRCTGKRRHEWDI